MGNIMDKTPNEEKQTKKTNTEKKQAEKHFPPNKPGMNLMYSNQNGVSDLIHKEEVDYCFILTWYISEQK